MIRLGIDENEDLVLVVQCARPEDLRDRVLYVPLR